MKWIDFKPRFITRRNIDVKQLGIPMLVVVKTRLNGGVS